MFERFRKTGRTEDGGGAVSVRERQDKEARDMDDASRPTRSQDPSSGERFTRTPSERDRAMYADEPQTTPHAATVGDDGARRHGPVLDKDAMHTMRDRQRDRFGGFSWGCDFFGWLCAIGLASLLTAILVGAGVALGVSTTDAADTRSAETIGLGGGIALLAVLAIAWFCGGYVAGRMARFDGARQGVGVWLWTILAVLVVAALAAIGGSEYDIFQRLSLPRIAIGEDTLTSAGAITGAAALLVTLLSAVLGGKMGERFHKRVDRVATDEYVVDR